MNISDFTYLLQKPEKINEQQTEAVATIIKEFPYFQSARAVHLKGLKNQDSFKYNQALKTAAAYTTDRDILFDFITSKKFLQHKVSEKIKEQSFDLKGIEVEADVVEPDMNLAMENSLRTKLSEAKAVLDPELFQPKETPVETVEEEKVATTETPQQETSPEETLQLGKPLSFDKTETHSFNEWLKLSSFKPIIREEAKEETEETALSEEVSTPDSVDQTKQDKFALIDRFIEKSPKIVPVKKQTSEVNLAEQVSIDKNQLMTETLAKVYLEQKKYKKAIQAYKILSLKYPEKSGFFADQIKAVKKLQQNNS